MTRSDLESTSPAARLTALLREAAPRVIREVMQADGTLREEVDLELLQEELSCEATSGALERYRLDWPGKRASLALANSPIDKTLRPAREESVEFDTTRNLYIEGDNLDALKLLQETYLGKVRMIYIDPPYNTGNDFIYEDDFSMSRAAYESGSGGLDEQGRALFDEEKWKKNSHLSGKFHSDWLSMIYPRLRLARNLLADDGCIFISIDDGEVANLRKIGEEVFGEANFVANLIWEKKYTRANDARWFSDNHDHILCFAKNKELLHFNQLPRNEKQMESYANPDNHPKGRWKATPLHAKSGTNASPYTFSNGIVWTPPPGTFRRFNNESMKKMDEGGEIWFGKDGGQTPSRKSFLSEVKDGVTPVTLWPYGEVGHNHEANNNVKELGLGGLFNNPKPVRLLAQMLRLTCSARDSHLVLDFFSGSATTAHAVMQMNAEDGGNRRYIMVQLPERCDEKSEAFKSGYKTIPEIGKERIRRAGTKVRKELEERLAKELPGSDEHTSIKARLDALDTGFRVLKMDSGSRTEVFSRPADITQEELSIQVDNLKTDRTEEDLLFQVMLDWGTDLLSSPIHQETIAGKTVFFADGNALAACFSTGVDDALIRGIAGRTPIRAVFRDGGFSSDSAKINAAQLFKALSPHTELKTI